MGKKNQPKMRRRNHSDSLSEDEFESLTITEKPLREVDSLSAFEKLPAEVAWKIIGYAPEAIFALRLTSRLLNSRANEYVRMFSSPIVREVRLKKICYDSNDYFSGSMMVSSSCSELFELLLKRHHPLINFNQRLQRFDHRTSKNCRKDEVEYRFEVSFDDVTRLDYLRACVGKRIEEATLLVFFSDYGEIEDRAHSQFFEGIQIDILNIEADLLSESATKHILKFIIDHGVYKLSLDAVGYFWKDSANVLLELASIVRSMSIIQNKWQVSRNQRLFDGRQFDWTPVIIAMFSRQLDKLYVENHHYNWYFPQECAEELTLRLPFLDKQVWLSVSMGLREQKSSTPVTGELNNTFFEVSAASDKHRILNIKHLSRIEEPL